MQSYRVGAGCWCEMSVLDALVLKLGVLVQGGGAGCGVESRPGRWGWLRGLSGPFAEAAGPHAAAGGAGLFCGG